MAAQQPRAGAKRRERLPDAYDPYFPPRRRSSATKTSQDDTPYDPYFPLVRRPGATAS